MERGIATKKLKLFLPAVFALAMLVAELR